MYIDNNMCLNKEFIIWKYESLFVLYEVLKVGVVQIENILAIPSLLATPQVTHDQLGV